MRSKTDPSEVLDTADGPLARMEVLTLSHDSATTAGTEFAGWRIMRSDAGRLWASREQPFPPAAEEAGACRTVDADDLRELCRAIAQQESVAEMTVTQ